MGDLTLSSNGTEIIGLWFTGQKYLSVPFPENYEEKDLPVFVQAVHWLDDYLEEGNRNLCRLFCRRARHFERRGGSSCMIPCHRVVGRMEV